MHLTVRLVLWLLFLHYSIIVFAKFKFHTRSTFQTILDWWWILIPHSGLTTKTHLTQFRFIFIAILHYIFRLSSLLLYWTYISKIIQSIFLDQINALCFSLDLVAVLIGIIIWASDRDSQQRHWFQVAWIGQPLDRLLFNRWPWLSLWMSLFRGWKFHQDCRCHWWMPAKLDLHSWQEW